MSLKRSRGEGDLTALAPPTFAASSAAKRRRTDSGPSNDRRESFDVLTSTAQSWDSALLSAYMVDHTSTPVSIDEEDAPQWSGSWAGHSAQMAFLFGKRAPPPRPPSRTVEEVDYDASDDEAAEGDVNKVARAFAKGHRLRRGFFASGSPTTAPDAPGDESEVESNSSRTFRRKRTREALRGVRERGQFSDYIEGRVDGPR